VTDTADVIVIGAGIHGASTAFHLAERGARVAIVERSAAASGATGRSSGLVRMHYDLAAESELAHASFPYFTGWADRVGGDCGFVRTGFLRIVPPTLEPALRANVARQQQMGISTSVITAAEAKEIAPGIAADDFTFAAYEPDSGYADPTGACAGFLAGARRHGATLQQGSSVEAVDVEDGRVIGVRTSRGSIRAPVVVIAAGAWSAALARTAGVEIDVRAWHHDTGYVSLPESVASWLPTVIDDINELYFRREGASLALVGLEDGNRIDDRADDESRSDAQLVEKIVDRLCRRVPAFADAEFHTAHGGTDGISADQHPIIGRHGPEGLVLQCGMSGTGFKIAPAVGLAVSELVLDGKARSIDISPFDPGRFARGELLVADHPYGDLWH
jgi:glycine/D-amino acid oxidase-like deaminating enzyme